MKKTEKIFIFGLLLFLGALPRPGFSETSKIATVDLSRAFDEYEKTKEFDKVLDEKGRQKKAERDKKVGEIQKLKEEMGLLNEEGKREKQAIMDQEIRELQEFDRAVRDDLRAERDHMVREILREIDEVIQAYGRENEHTLILNDRVLLYKKEALDVTDEIIKRLNQKEKGKKR